MKKLWQTTAPLDAAVEAYTVGEDPALDARLLRCEVLGSLAHACGLARIGVLTPGQLEDLRRELVALLSSAAGFTISREQEDVHTAVEQALTRALGETGARIHAGRSRNDQVQADLRLHLKDRLLELHAQAGAAAAAWQAFAERFRDRTIPGYSHLQRAMPTTLGHWAASHVEALVEGQATLRRAYEEADSCPLGSAAGYGVMLPLDRAYVAKLLGFSRVQRNTLRVQSSRPRLEAAVVAALALVARDLGVLAWDLSLYSSAEFGFLKLDDSFTTGSSLMPQKKNPDVAELTRARAALFPGWVSQLLAIGALPSGYHRDYQLTKGPLFAALDEAGRMLDMAARLPGSLRVREDRCAAAVTEDLLATHEAVALVREGRPFRDAYRAVAERARARTGDPKPVAAPPLPDYAGAPGRPDWKALSADRTRASAWSRGERRRLDAAWGALLAPTRRRR
ncbi:MAG: argininosuccinate lyase [Elusimicrobia bacterium]|nr:argininosuccinate lyase [Elusimicrobiota bacterium]